MELIALTQKWLREAMWKRLSGKATTLATTCPCGAGSVVTVADLSQRSSKNPRFCKQENNNCGKRKEQNIVLKQQCRTSKIHPQLWKFMGHRRVERDGPCWMLLHSHRSCSSALAAGTFPRYQVLPWAAALWQQLRDALTWAYGEERK